MKRFLQTLFVLLCLVFSSGVNAQVTIGSNNKPSNDALLDLRENTVDSTSTKGLLLPRVALSSTTAYSPMSAHVKGMTVYNTATEGNVTPGYYYNDGTKWVRMADAAALGNYWSIIGNSGTDPATNFIGTTDNADLIFKRNNVQSGWINAILFNTAFGVNSLPTTSSGMGNTSFGYNTLTSNSTGNNNTAVGLSALAVNTRGYSNTAVGNYAAEKNDVGIQNVAIGVSALTSNVSGGHNVAVGSAAGLYATGSSNTLLGDYVATGLTSGNSNIVLGASQELASNTGSNQLNIGGAIFGTGLSGSVAAPAGLIGIGTVDPTNRLHVNATADPLRLQGLQSSSTTDSVMTVTGTGVMKYQKAATLVAEPWYSTVTNTGATANTDSVYIMGKVGIGYSAPMYQLNVNGDIVGKRGMFSPAKNGGQSIAIGPNSLASLASDGGYGQIAIGYKALSSIANPYNANIAIGYGALEKLTSVGANVAIGNGVLPIATSSGANVAIGQSVMPVATTASNNIIIGGNSTTNLTTGNSNVAIGADVAQWLSTGSNNIIIGRQQNVATSTGSNQLNIGGAIFGTDLTGSVTTPAGLIGIGTVGPTNRLHVNATADPLRLQGLQSTSTSDSVMMVSGTGVVKYKSISTLYIPGKLINVTGSTISKVNNLRIVTATASTTIDAQSYSEGIFRISSASSYTLAAFNNAVDGGVYNFHLINTGTGTITVTFPSTFKTEGLLTLSSITIPANSAEMVTFYSYSGNHYTMEQ